MTGTLFVDTHFTPFFINIYHWYTNVIDLSKFNFIWKYVTFSYLFWYIFQPANFFFIKTDMLQRAPSAAHRAPLTINGGADDIITHYQIIHSHHLAYLIAASTSPRGHKCCLIIHAYLYQSYALLHQNVHVHNLSFTQRERNATTCVNLHVRLTHNSHVLDVPPNICLRDEMLGLVSFTRQTGRLDRRLPVAKRVIFHHPDTNQNKLESHQTKKSIIMPVRRVD